MADTLRSRTHEWSDVALFADAARTMDGLAFLRAMAAGTLPPPPIAATIGMTITAVESGDVTFALLPAEYHYNPIGSVHGGVIATILDSAMGCAVHTQLLAGDAYTTTDLQIRYVRGLSEATGTVTCRGTVVSMGRRTATAEAKLVDASGKLLAYGTTGILVMRAT